MPWVLQILWLIALFVGIGIAIYISFWILLVMFAIGIIAVIWVHLRDFLLEKGILNPVPGVPNGIIIEQEPETTVTLIDGDFTRVEDEAKKE